MTDLHPQPGDVILVKTNHFVSRLIRFGQRSYGPDCAQWNHVGIVVFEDYDKGPVIVEALTSGVVESPLSKYRPDQIQIVKVEPHILIYKNARNEMRNNARDFALRCVGEKYGWITIFAIALKTLTKGRWNFGVQGTSICSGLVARSLERMGYNFQPDDPAELTPAYLAKELR